MAIRWELGTWTTLHHTEAGREVSFDCTGQRRQHLCVCIS
mgnify:CR=1 FL=1